MSTTTEQPRAAEVGKPVRVIEVLPTESPVPDVLPLEAPEEAPALEPLEEPEPVRQ